jgi:hypothetical protein
MLSTPPGPVGKVRDLENQANLLMLLFPLSYVESLHLRNTQPNFRLFLRYDLSCCPLPSHVGPAKWDSFPSAA